MFTGIIETLGTITNITKEQGNTHLTIKSNFTNELKVDQSVAHNGVCLTVVNIENDEYTVTAIKETLDKTNIGNLSISDFINLERGMKLGDRLDGHIVQGHVDQKAICTNIKKENGSTIFTFTYDPSNNNITIEKGSITVSGVSLTVVNSKKNEFSVAIIPYTIENTTFKYIELGDAVNLEFDVIGKYISRLTNS
ncbi:riboflavin synthase [Polaribacter sp. Hel1_85]|uniref:riboflavin synthase n=1 Tax=Polaribacter sp. Hel1_85 TaxID=1250005 RepID=UPI00052B5CFC|nr:riboflavin synthase [Polaribacter sp. Hel1_85]KGL58736.1 riboflavin synthase subunit alpha [Polaribacter sp. Hel1_85]